MTMKSGGLHFKKKRMPLTLLLKNGWPRRLNPLNRHLHKSCLIPRVNLYEISGSTRIGIPLFFKNPLYENGQ
jgi:hypothetical protein